MSVEDKILSYKGVKQIALLKRYREIKNSDNKSVDYVYLITNLSHQECTPEEFLELNRSYWSIENKLHYIKDMVFGEDRSTIRAKFGAQNMSSLRNFAVGLLHAMGVANIKRFVDNLKYNTSYFLQAAFGF